MFYSDYYWFNKLVVLINEKNISNHVFLSKFVETYLTFFLRCISTMYKIILLDIWFCYTIFILPYLSILFITQRKLKLISSNIRWWKQLNFFCVAFGKRHFRLWTMYDRIKVIATYLVSTTSVYSFYPQEHSYSLLEVTYTL